LRITLWGQWAKDLCIRSVYDEENAKPIAALFVGCLAKNSRGSKMQTNIVHTYTYICYVQKNNIHICNTTRSVYLSGSAACDWYFNPTIPEAEPYYIRYKRAKKYVSKLLFL
jgi:hypothetical protein